MDKNLHLKKYNTCYFDVLGTKKKDVFESAYNMWLILQSAKKECNLTNHLIIRSFSDNFLVACESELSSSLDDVINRIGYVYSISLLSSFTLIRGAIVCDELFFTDEIVLGSALVKSYDLENNVAIYPRIILSSEIGVKGSKSFKDPFVVDEDGIIFLNCLKFINQDYLKVNREVLFLNLNKRRDELIKNNTMKEAAKINWVINYVANYFQENFNND